MKHLQWNRLVMPVAGVVLGLFLVARPWNATAALCSFIGWLVLLAGICGIVNALAFHSGVVCDGAKSSCAAKISMAVEAGIFGYQMYQNGQEFRTGDGIISDGVEHTIQNVGELGRQGMRETDHVILEMMTREPC